MEACLTHPIYEPVRPALELLARTPEWPDCARLNALAHELGSTPRTSSGRPVRFTAPPVDGRNYELRVHESGAVATRAHNWHDLFNALAWLAFPRLKAALNARHAERIPHEGGRRGPLRDLLTIFDEGGAIVASRDPALIELIRGHRWRELFWERRDDLRHALRFVVVGHAVLEQARSPWPGITCKALFVADDAGLLDLPTEHLVAHLDARAAEWFATAAEHLTPRALAPLPVFGYPGWHPGNACEAFYADARYFRTFRRTA